MGPLGPADAEAPRAPEDNERERAHRDQRDERLDEVAGVGRHESAGTAIVD